MKKMLLLLLSSILLAGCWDMTEPERMYYVHAVGIDYVDGQFEIYAQIIDFSNVAKTEQPNPEAVQAEVGKARGNTVDEAFFSLYESLDMRLFWGHLSYLLFSEEALKEGRLNTVLNSFNRYRETRYQTWVYATNEDLNDVLLVSPVLNKSIALSKMSNPKNSFDQQSFIDPKDFRRTIVEMSEPNYSISIPYVSISESWKDKKGNPKNIRIDGIAYVSNEGLKQIVKAEHVKGLQWLTKATKRTEVTFKIREHDVTATIESTKVKVKPVKGKEAKFEVAIHVNAVVSSFNTELSGKEAKKHIKEEIEKQIRDTYNFGLQNNIDIYRLSHVLYKKDLKKWQKFEKDGQIELTDSTLNQIDVYVDKVSGARKELTETIKK